MRFRCRTFLGDGLKVTFEALVAAGHPEGEQHDVGGGHQREGARQGRAKSEAARDRGLGRERCGRVLMGAEEAPHLCRMRPLMGNRASYTVRASPTQLLASMRNEATVRRMKEPGTEVSFTWQLTPPQEEKTLRGTLDPERLAYSLSTHSEPAWGREGGRIKACRKPTEMNIVNIFLLLFAPHHGPQPYKPDYFASWT